MTSVEFVGPFHHYDVIVDGRRVPFLQGKELDGGRVALTFDRSYGLDLDAGNYEQVVRFVAYVIERAMNPDCGRTFHPVHEITEASGEGES
jgi:hypothetical protein